MSIDYSAIAVDAAAVIQEFGVDAIFVTTISQGVTSSRTKKVVMVEQVMQTASDRGDSGLKLGDWKLLCESGAVPIEGDSCTISGQRYMLFRVEPIQPGGYPVAYWAYGRKS